MSRTIFLVIAAIGMVAAGWFFVSPLFIERVVDEAPPIPSAAEVRAMSPAERDAAMSALMREAAHGETTVDESMDASVAPAQVAIGTFSDADAVHKGTGKALIYRLGDGSHVVRFEQFRVTNGPALVVLLAQAADPKSAAEVSRGYLKLGELKGNVGNQNYPVPADVDISSYGSVVIWCDLFDVLFSAAPLNPL